jgi:hypothetical protein
MAQSQVDVANSALQRLGAAAITSLSDGSPEARAVSISYDSNRRDELRKFPWNFTMKRAVLAPDATAPAFDYTYQFTMPSDCLRVVRPNYDQSDWVIEGRKILTNYDNPLYLRYIADIVDESQWDASFYNVFAIALAIDMCEKLTQSNAKKQLLYQEYKDAIAEARRSDAIEGGPVDPQDDDWWLVRL